jgi:hypothetical protein
MIIKAFVNSETNGQGRTYFVGECEAILLGTNCAELDNEPVMFYGETKASVVGQIIEVLKARGLTGKLRVV